MKFHFDPNQQYQLDAVNSIISIFEGQPLEHGDLSFTIDEKDWLFQTDGVGNRLTLSEEQILENVINNPNDKLTGKKPIEFIQTTSPVVIVDEPQNMETEIRKRAIENLNPLCTLRYSATHINRYNMVYSLDPVKAYDLGLVKQIEVDSIVTENDFNKALVCLEKTNATKTRTSAKVRIDVNTKDGVKRKSVTVKVGDDLYDLSNKREIYKNGYIVNGIDVGDGFIELSNGERLLDTEEPLRFIFSHSALREGWDNPNVFQICTLNETQSELKKRQEIGRGLILSVNQEGNRIQDTNINLLTVIANEAYEDFAKQLQSEIEEDCGVSFKGRIKNKRKEKD